MLVNAELLAFTRSVSSAYSREFFLFECLGFSVYDHALTFSYHDSPKAFFLFTNVRVSIERDVINPIFKGGHGGCSTSLKVI